MQSSGLSEPVSRLKSLDSLPSLGSKFRATAREPVQVMARGSRSSEATARGLAYWLTGSAWLNLLAQTQNQYS